MVNKWFLLLGLVAYLSASRHGYGQEVEDMDIDEARRLLLGKWVSVKDSLAVIEFIQDKKYSYYKGEGLTSVNDYEVSLDLPVDDVVEHHYSLSDKKKFLYVYILNEETGRIRYQLDYEIVALKEDSYLSLLYLGGRLLNYRRVKE